MGVGVIPENRLKYDSVKISGKIRIISKFEFRTTFFSIFFPYNSNFEIFNTALILTLSYRFPVLRQRPSLVLEVYKLWRISVTFHSTCEKAGLASWNVELKFKTTLHCIRPSLKNLHSLLTKHLNIFQVFSKQQLSNHLFGGQCICFPWKCKASEYTLTKLISCVESVRGNERACRVIAWDFRV